MTKAELVKELTTESGCRRTDVEKMLEALSKVVLATLAGGDDVNLAGLGRLRTVRREERKGRNPRTGQELTIPARMRVTFVSSSTLKDAVQ